MKTKIIYISLMLLCGLMWSCDYEVIWPRGEVTTREVNFSGYSALEISDAFRVNVRFSDIEEKIEIEATENLHDRIIVEMEGNTLRVGLKKHTSIKGSATLNAFIVTKNISDFDVSGASKVTLESELSVPKAILKVSGASEFAGELILDQLELEASGASKIDFFGNTTSLDASLSGASTLKNYDLVINELDIRMAGASDAYLSVSESIDIDASGASRLNYKGNAIVNQKRLSGASEIVEKK